MPVKVLNLGEKRYVKSLFTIGRSHLLGNVIDKFIYYQSSNNDLKVFSSYFKNNRIRKSIPSV